ncbi:MAG: RtcB family protein [Aureispira sp.]|nr:RtcB family protein [Aureispira sp.]
MKYKNYAEVLDGAAWSQFMEAMKQDFVVKGALMPDAHKGYSLPIGAVVACDNFVVPAYVGYDIGCGMSAIKITGVTAEDIINNKDGIFDAIYKGVPVGFAKNAASVKLPEVLKTMQHSKEVTKLIPLAKQQLGTLGGGNHFIEIGKGAEDAVWVVIHSGSRGVGHKIATHYMKLAGANRPKLELEFDASHKDLKKYNPTDYEAIKEKWVKKKLSKATAKEGHFGFVADSDIGKTYICDALYAQTFALENRSLMINRVIKAMEGVLDKTLFRDADSFINRNHNHVVKREVEGKICYIHRKGATHAEEGMMGVIPGNMLDGSFVVKGKGNPDSLYSSSHGAGRVLGRKAAKEQLSVDDFTKQMIGIKARVDFNTLDESPSAYKNIFEVMNAQTELVDVVDHITPLINIKG